MRTVAGIVAATILGLILIYAVSVMAHGPVVTLTVAGEAPTATPTCTYREVRTPTPADPTQTPTPIPYADCALTTDPAGDPGGAYNLANLPLWRFDVNNSGIIDNTDKALVQAFIGGGVPTWTPTPTNTPTLTPTPTNTNTPVPTATPTPPLFSTSELINDVTNTCTVSGATADDGNCVGVPHYPVQGALCDPPVNWDWGKAGKGLGKGAPQGTDVTPWWTAQWNGCGDSATDVDIVIQNFYAYGWTGSTWITYGGSWRQWCGIGDTSTNAPYSACTPAVTDCNAPSGNTYDIPTGQQAIHGAYCGQADQNVQCVVAVYQAKSTGSKDIVANAGTDHKDGGTNLYDLFISRYKLLNTSTWTQVGGTSCTAATITNNPPPNF